MSGVPGFHRFTGEMSWEQARPLVDDNFLKAIQSTADLGARTTKTVSFTLAIAATTSFYKTVVLANPGLTSSYSYVNLLSPENGVSAAVPIIQVYIDTNNTATYLWPNGSSLTSGQKNLTISAKKDLTAVDGVTSFTISGFNGDSSSHNYYVTFSVAYFPSPPQGIFR